MKLPVDTQSFELIRKGNYVYVDKTDLIYDLVTNGYAYLLNRPKKFGKSLLISTLKSYFDGQKELFQGLAIEKLEQDWKKRPIFLFDFTKCDFTKEGLLEQEIENYLCEWEKLYGKNENENTTSGRFIGLLKRASEQYHAHAVVLVDDYDKPLLDVLNQGKTPEEIAHYTHLFDQHRRELLNIFGSLKSGGRYLRFVLLTGVTNSLQGSVFSGLNHLNHITFDETYAAICGITQTELTDIFPEQLQQLADRYKVSVPEVIEMLKTHFYGYRFSTGELKVYNPFSLLSTLDNSKIDDYWYSTGSPAYPMQLMEKRDIAIEEIVNREYDKLEFASCTDEEPHPVPMLYQFGYLTIKSFIRDDNLYTLDFPNREVRQAFLLAQSVEHFNIDPRDFTTLGNDLSNMLEEKRIDEFLQHMKAFLASVPYKDLTNIKKHRTPEFYFFHSFCLILRMIAPQNSIMKVKFGLFMECDDCIYETPDYVFIFVFKQDQNLDKTMQKFEEKNYAAAYANDKRQMYKIAVNCSTQTRTIEEWRIEEGK